MVTGGGLPCDAAATRYAPAAIPAATRTAACGLQLGQVVEVTQDKHGALASRQLADPAKQRLAAREAG
jgi:hypothetical protein